MVFRYVILSFAVVVLPFYSHAQTPKEALWDQYVQHCQRPSDIYEHLPTLRRLSAECSSVTELGVRAMVSTWALLQGLSESSAPHHTYLGVDLALPPVETYELAKNLSEQNGITFDFWVANDLEISLAPVDLLFIDTLHIYPQLTYELETFCNAAQKYIVMHDTGEPYQWKNCASYTGDFSEYPPSIDCTKQGMWTAVLDFLARHPEWEVTERYPNNCGLTVLRRKSERPTLLEQYTRHAAVPSDINEHLPTLRRLASECTSVVELGHVHRMVSTWALLQGLADRNTAGCSYLGVDHISPPPTAFLLAQSLCQQHGIFFSFWGASELNITLYPIDLLFIDSFHTYQHLSYELEAFGSCTQKYIVMHDTELFGKKNETDQFDSSVYPPSINRSKKGLWHAILDFLDRHPEWVLSEWYYNNCGLTVLKREGT